MIQQFKINENLNTDTTGSILKAWALDENKVFHLKSNTQKDYVREFYEKIGNKIGQYKLLAEDVQLGNRRNQKADKIWMDVRYDSNIDNAYRHSSNPQPLHTDGSYNPDFPNATLMCCVSNSVTGGETIFLELKKLVEVLKVDDSELLELLFNEEVIHERTGYTNKKKILYIENGNYKINFNYFCISKENSKKNLKFIEKFFHYLNKSEKIINIIRPIKLNAGDAVFWKDSEVLHGRNGFKPKKDSDRFLWKAAIEIGK